MRAQGSLSGESVLPIPSDTKDVGCHADHDGTLPFFAATSDGAWGYVSDDGDVSGTVIDLASGATRRMDAVYGTIGRYLFGPSHDETASTATALVLDAAGGAAVGSIPADAIYFGTACQSYAPGGVTRSRDQSSDTGRIFLTSDGQDIVAKNTGSAGVAR